MDTLHVIPEDLREAAEHLFVLSEEMSHDYKAADDPARDASSELENHNFQVGEAIQGFSASWFPETHFKIRDNAEAMGKFLAVFAEEVVDIDLYSSNLFDVRIDSDQYSINNHSFGRVLPNG